LVTAGSPDAALGGIDELATSLTAIERRENFPVALRILPPRFRDDLRAVYGVARTIDQVGDELVGDRLALLDAYAADLHLAWMDAAWTPASPRLAVNVAIADVVRRRGLSEPPFQALVEANRMDQRVTAYRSWDELRGYCALSADPVGRIVLEVAGASSPRRITWSDDVCTALQLLEHCQDVGEDRRRGRVYLPAADLDAHGVAVERLDDPVASPELRATIRDEVARARELLGSGRPLVRELSGAAKLAVAGFVAGGLATADAIEAADGEVLGALRTPRRRDVVRHALRLLAGRS
jgi:squalene synthase HpnC